MSSLALPKSKSDVSAWLKQIKWKQVLIGDLSRIDVMDIFFRRAWDIVLCGIGSAFVLLIAFAAFALPHEVRALVWVGCAFLLALTVDRPSFSAVIALPLTMMIVSAGAITLAGVQAGFSPNLLFYFNLQYALPIPFGALVAFFIAHAALVSVASAFAQTDAEREADAIQTRLRKELGIRSWDLFPRKDGALRIALHKNFPVNERLSEIKALLQREIVLDYGKRTKRPILILPPVSASKQPEVISHVSD